MKRSFTKGGRLKNTNNRLTPNKEQSRHFIKPSVTKGLDRNSWTNLLTNYQNKRASVDRKFRTPCIIILRSTSSPSHNSLPPLGRRAFIVKSRVICQRSAIPVCSCLTRFAHQTSECFTATLCGVYFSRVAQRE